MLKIDKVSGREVLMESDIPFLKVFKKGKVREVYELGEYLLIVATDRLSAFDVVMKSGIPHKGVYLTKQSSFWFKFLNQKGYLTHFVTDDIGEMAKLTGEKRLCDLPWLKGRAMLGKKAELVPVEAVCRFRVFGSAVPALKENKWIWDAPEIDGEIKEGALIKNGPLFTPTEKSETDDKISFDQMVKIVGDKTRAEEIKNKTLEIFRLVNDHAQKTFNFEIADGKIEWGLFGGKLMLIDETFTSDSARFMPDKSKEFFRSWLKDNNLKGQAVALPDDIALAVADLYAAQCRSMRVL